MKEKNKNRSRALGIVWFVIGIALVASDNAGGWVFFIIGLVYLASSTEQGEQLIARNPKLARGILIGLSILLVLVVAGFVIVNYFMT
ncbi:MAG: hypothetical protein PVF74_08550 [Anaerolineales bacterium]|jgi:hypothetical protein